MEKTAVSNLSTAQLVLELKQEGQDFEWYPTDNLMINVVKGCIPQDVNSILDIGAGDGRVLAKLAKKAVSALLYGIELSPILIQVQPENIVPVGTQLFEQNLSCIPVDYIFCNPPYSEFDEWVCKIVSEGYAKKAFFVIPQRWTSSKTIKRALELRNATARVIHSGDFHDAERQARAVIDIVEISYPMNNTSWRAEPLDPFDIWFDANVSTFDKPKDFVESQTGEDLARKFSNATIEEMVEAYDDEYNRMQENYRAIFRLDLVILQELGVNKKAVRDGLKLKMSGLKTKYWGVLFDRLDAITSRLSTASKKKLLEKLTRNTSVAFTASNCYTVVLWSIKNANQYFDAQLLQFRDLATFEGVLNYKSNIKVWKLDSFRFSKHDWEKQATHYKLDYRIVVEKWSAINKESHNKWDYPGDLSRSCHEMIADIVAVMSNLGFFTTSTSSLDRWWTGGKWQDFYKADGEILFQAKAYMEIFTFALSQMLSKP